MKTTVGELIEKLKMFPKDMRVVMSQDAEGNGFMDPDTVTLENGKAACIWPEHAWLEEAEIWDEEV